MPTKTKFDRQKESLMQFMTSSSRYSLLFVTLSFSQLKIIFEFGQIF